MPLPDQQRLSDAVYTVLGMNPGPFTLEGTNTYLVGSGSSRILIDTGEGVDAYEANLKKAVEGSGCKDIEHILITHNHPDHVGGIKSVLKQFPGASVWKKVSKTGHSCDPT